MTSGQTLGYQALRRLFATTEPNLGALVGLHSLVRKPPGPTDYQLPLNPPCLPSVGSSAPLSTLGRIAIENLQGSAPYVSL